MKRLVVTAILAAALAAGSAQAQDLLSGGTTVTTNMGVGVTTYVHTFTSTSVDGLTLSGSAQLEVLVVVVVAYINCTAAVKAHCDIICTSGNAVKMVNSIPADKQILFVPDQNLGQWVMTQTGREMILRPGSCSTHVLFTHKAIYQLKQMYPDAKIVAHPECLPAVRMLAIGR